jgi:hypothetical protein
VQSVGDIDPRRPAVTVHVVTLAVDTADAPPDVSADQYFRTVAAAMVAHGWREGLPPNQHMFGRNLSKDGVNALLYSDRDSTTRDGSRQDGSDHRPY